MTFVISLVKEVLAVYRDRFKEKKGFSGWLNVESENTEAEIREQVVDEILTMLDADPDISVLPSYTTTLRDDIDNKRNIP